MSTATPARRRPRRSRVARTSRRRRALGVAGYVLAAYLVVRALVEPFVLAPSSGGYHHDWGGPTLLGVLVVHTGPGVLALLVVLRHWHRSR